MLGHKVFSPVQLASLNRLTNNGYSLFLGCGNENVKTAKITGNHWTCSKR